MQISERLDEKKLKKVPVSPVSEYICDAALLAQNRITSIGSGGSQIPGGLHGSKCLMDWAEEHFVFHVSLVH